MNKVIKDGKVAVIISTGYGSGFSTWIDAYSTEELVFEPIIVNRILNNDPIPVELFISLYPKMKDRYIPRLDDLEIEWVSLGEKFYIDEYDGNESIVMEKDINWLVAKEETAYEIYEAKIAKSCMRESEEMYDFFFKGEYTSIPTGLYRFMANSLEEAKSWFNLHQVEYVKYSGPDPKIVTETWLRKQEEVSHQPLGENIIQKNPSP